MKNKQLKKQLKALKRAAASTPVTPPPAITSVSTAPPITVKQWMPAYAQILLDRKYCPQTLRNRRANQKHILRTWGGQAVGGPASL